MSDEEEKRFLEWYLWESAPTASELAKTLPKIPVLVRHPVKCGKPNCRCTRGELHDAWRLYWRGADGRQRFRYVSKADLDTVRAILDERREERARQRRIAAMSLRRLREIEAWVRQHETTNGS